jgi:hypothetical protein
MRSDGVEFEVFVQDGYLALIEALRWVYTVDGRSKPIPIMCNTGIDQKKGDAVAPPLQSLLIPGIWLRTLDSLLRNETSVPLCSPIRV